MAVEAALIESVAGGNPAGTAKALKAGADPNTCADGYPLLCLAAAAGDAEVTKVLLAGGASPHLLDARMGTSALHKAAQSGVVDVARALVAHGAFIDLQAPTHGHTPLIDAVLHRKLAMVNYLVEDGANLFVTARGMLAPSYTALDLARLRNDRDIIDSLEASEAAARNSALPPLHAATKADDEVSFVACSLAARIPTNQHRSCPAKMMVIRRCILPRATAICELRASYSIAVAERTFSITSCVRHPATNRRLSTIPMYSRSWLRAPRGSI